MTPLDQALLLIQQDPRPLDIGEQLSDLEEEAKGTVEEEMIARLWEDLDISQPEVEKRDTTLVFS